MMRIITGKARGTRLLAPAGERTRPTAERVKEAVFSMIQFDIEGREVLDLFAGSGQMGLEALSRGAAHATFIDHSGDAIQIIRKNAEKTRLLDSCTILQGDFADVLGRLAGRAKFDIVFIDPPYGQGLVAKSLELLDKYRLLGPGALIVCEGGETDIFGGSPVSSRFEVIKTRKYGITQITLLSPYRDRD
ncbi:MAG: 16S rRNA (guanine(966)-N(2))-methyltransferase RsmD [Eubacteriales bacterium]|jgi:16S rRNA (guanine(966)-N(2))-methyltransferase RsmD